MNLEERNEKVCVCGTTLKKFYETGLFGCEKCYETFFEELLPVLQKTQRGTRHYSLKESKEREEAPSFALEEAKSDSDKLSKRFYDLLNAGNVEDAEKIAVFLKKQREELD